MYGIRVPIAVDDYLWVLDHAKSDSFNPKPLSFKTKDEALDHAKIWGPLAVVKKIEEA